MKFINAISGKIKCKKGNAEDAFMTVIIVLVVSTFAALGASRIINKKKADKANIIISNYGSVLENQGYLSDSDKAKLNYELKEVGFSEVEIFAPSAKENDNKTITLSVTVNNINSRGGVIDSHNFIREVAPRNKE